MLCCKHSCGVSKAVIVCTNFQREIGYLLNFIYCVGNFYVHLFHTIELILDVILSFQTGQNILLFTPLSIDVVYHTRG